MRDSRLMSWAGRVLLLGAGLGWAGATGAAGAEPVAPEAVSMQITSAEPAYLFAPDQPLRLTVEVDRPQASQSESPPLILEAKLTPYRGERVEQQRVEVGDADSVELELPAQPVGLYELTVVLRSVSGDEPIQTATVPLGVAPLAEPRPVEPDSPFGVVAHLNRMSDAEREHTVQLMARAGVRWAREGFLWDAIEPAEGQFDWATYDHLVDTCQRYGISVLPVLAYGTTWAASDPEHGGSAAGRTTAPRLDAWRRYVEAVARRYGDRIRVWEVWNEPNSTTFFRPAPGMSRADSYAQLLAAAYETLKRVDPEAKVMIGGFTPKHWLPDQPHLHEATFMEAIYRQQPVPFDILGYHPYTAPHTETTNRASVEKYLRLPGPCWEAMRAHGEEGKPTWMTEMGTPTMSFMSADRAAEYLVVLYVTGMADPRIEKNFWYDFRDDGTDPKNKEHHFGLLRHDGAPKPGYLAYYTLTRLLEGAAFVDRQEHDGAAIHRFQTPDGQVLVVWAQGDESASLTLETGGSSAQVLGVTGGPVDFEQEAGVLKLTATPSPTFVILH